MFRARIINKSGPAFSRTCAKRHHRVPGARSSGSRTRGTHTLSVPAHPQPVRCPPRRPSWLDIAGTPDHSRVCFSILRTRLHALASRLIRVSSMHAEATRDEPIRCGRATKMDAASNRNGTGERSLRRFVSRRTPALRDPGVLCIAREPSRLIVRFPPGATVV
jgi:hypothetical protein